MITASDRKRTGCFQLSITWLVGLGGEDPGFVVSDAENVACETGKGHMERPEVLEHAGLLFVWPEFPLILALSGMWGKQEVRPRGRVGVCRKVYGAGAWDD